MDVSTYFKGLKIALQNSSYLPTDEIELTIDANDKPELLEGLCNINVYIYHLETNRNRLAYGFGSIPERQGNLIFIKRCLPADLVPGIYYVRGLKLIYDALGQQGKELSLISGKEISKLIFQIANDSRLFIDKDQLEQQFQRLQAEREQYIHTPHITSYASLKNNALEYIVVIFAVGCLVHNRQDMQGYSIYPLKSGYSYLHMLNAVNSFLKPVYGLTLDYTESIDSSFSSATPLFVIEFKRVLAIDHDDAALHCSRLAENIFTLLAYEKGQRPRQFASVIINPVAEQVWQSFHFPGYRGNLISGFNPASTADLVENVSPLLAMSPWLDLLLRSYGEALSEENFNFALSKYWTLIEIIAKKRITDNNANIFLANGKPILRSDGKPEIARYALGKVYTLLFNAKMPPLHGSSSDKGMNIIFETYESADNNPNKNDKTMIFTLWDIVSALYEIRNSTIHSGTFNPVQGESGSSRQRMASRLYGSQASLFYDFVRLMAKTVVGQELQKAWDNRLNGQKSG